MAKLSRLKLTDEEIEKFQIELSEILDYVAQLDKTDTKGLKPTYQVTGLKNVMRKDKLAKYQAAPNKLMPLAPAVENNQYRVKRVLD